MPGSKFSVTDATGKPANATGKHLQDAINADPTIDGLDEMGIGLGSRSAKDVVHARNNALKWILKDRNSTKTQRAIANHRLQQTPMVILNKALVPVDEADDIISFKPGKVHVTYD